MQAHNITLAPSANNTQLLANQKFDCNISSFANVTNTSYDMPKRTRFSFKPEHLVVLISTALLFIYYLLIVDLIKDLGKVVHREPIS